MAKYQQGFPVNENGEIVTTTGSGSRNISSILPIDFVSTDDNNKVPLVLPEQIITQFSSPSGGSFSVTNNTSLQWFEIADLTGRLTQDTIVDMDVTFSYSMNTNAKLITYSIGPNTSSLTTLAGTSRTSGTETGLRAMFQFSVVDSNTLFRVASSLGAVGASGSTIGTLTYNTNQISKLYIGVQLSNVADSITCHSVQLKVSKK